MTTENEEPGQDRQGCGACRGTGQVISNLGGDPHTVTCPWCGGTGQFQPGHDAQEHISEGSPAAATGQNSPETRV